MRKDREDGAEKALVRFTKKFLRRNLHFSFLLKKFESPEPQQTLFVQGRK
jgi:hypothetical protein